MTVSSSDSTARLNKQVYVHQTISEVKQSTESRLSETTTLNESTVVASSLFTSLRV